MAQKKKIIKKKVTQALIKTSDRVLTEEEKKEKKLEVNRKYRDEHREEHNAYRRKYWKENRERLLEKRRKYQKDNAEKIKLHNLRKGQKRLAEQKFETAKENGSMAKILAFLLIFLLS